MRLLVGSAAVLVLVLTTACGGGSTTPTTGADVPTGGASSLTPFTPPPATPGGPAASTTCAATAAASGPVISMEGTHALNPSDETISAGDSVTWTNNSSTSHQISFSGGPKCDFTRIGDSVSIKFDTPGTYAYICTIHPTFMKGTITVQ